MNETSPSQNQRRSIQTSFLGPTCRPGGLAAAVDPVDLVGLRDVQLVPLRDLLEVGAFVERAPEPGLPHGGVGLVPPLPELAFIHGPGLSGGGGGLLMLIYQ